MCAEKMLPFVEIQVLLWYIGLKGSDMMHTLIAQYIEKPGNTSFLLDIPGCEKLYQRCKDAEEAIGKDYREFFRCIRLVLEEFAKKEELEFRIKKILKLIRQGLSLRFPKNFPEAKTLQIVQYEDWQKRTEISKSSVLYCVIIST